MELMALLAILRVGEDAYGVPISQELAATAGRTVTLAALYTVLDRLERRGLTASRLTEPTPTRGGRAKRQFEVTTAGLAAVRETQRTLSALWSNLPQLREQWS